MKLTYSITQENVYVDWPHVDGVGSEYESYFISGFKVHGQALRKFQGNYLVLYMETDENAGGLIDYRWDFHNTTDTKRFSQTETAYIHKTGTQYSARRVWLRGQGLALQIRLRSVDDKPFKVIGYAMWETGNANL